MFEPQTIRVEHKGKYNTNRSVVEILRTLSIFLDVIHDVVYDYYGQRMATCSSDQTVKVWDPNDKGVWVVTASWKAHSGSVWRGMPMNSVKFLIDFNFI